jgi:di/tricarboxylate transporter
VLVTTFADDPIEAPRARIPQPMTPFVTTVFVLTYLGMALGRIPGLRVDRTGIAMIAAVVLVAAGAVAPDEIAGAIHFPTLC